jgi:hypothetical protein
MPTDEILGVHMIGARAADIIAEAVVAMEFRASAEDIGTHFTRASNLYRSIERSGAGCYGKQVFAFVIVMIDNFYYNTIYIIESLDNSESHTGTMLYELIKNFEFKYTGVKTFLKTPKTKIEFFEVLSSINDSVQKHNCLPLIHLETHGNQDGIQCTNKDFITWGELYPFFIDINIKLKNTLIITTGICFGTNFYFNVDIDKPAPFFTLISSVSEITNNVILDSYERFYNELLNSENFNNAINCLNSDFLKPTDNSIILKRFILELLTHYKKLIAELSGKVNFLIISKKINNENEKIDLFIIKYEQQKQMLIGTLKTIWSKYLMLDLYPETKGRYKDIKDLLLENINKLDVDEKLKKDLATEVIMELT